MPNELNASNLKQLLAYLAKRYNAIIDYNIVFNTIISNGGEFLAVPVYGLITYTVNSNGYIDITDKLRYWLLYQANQVVYLSQTDKTWFIPNKSKLIALLPHVFETEAIIGELLNLRMIEKL